MFRYNNDKNRLQEKLKHLDYLRKRGVSTWEDEAEYIRVRRQLVNIEYNELPENDPFASLRK